MDEYLIECIGVGEWETVGQNLSEDGICERSGGHHGGYGGFGRCGGSGLGGPMSYGAWWV